LWKEKEYVHAKFSNKNGNTVKFLHMHLFSASFPGLMLTLLVFLFVLRLGVSFWCWSR